jgi:hypothetical protein
VDVGVDERGREHEALPVDHAVAVGLDLLAELRDDAAVDAHVERRVDAARGVEHARAAHDDAVPGSILDVEGCHHATSISTSASTGTGPCVSRS